MAEQFYNVVVWDLVDGGALECFDDITFDEVNEIEKQYDDKPEVNVVVTLSR